MPLLRRALLITSVAVMLVACGAHRTEDNRDDLLAARKRFTTHLVATPTEAREAPPSPPPTIFRLVRYDAEPGKLAAYLTPDPGDGAKHPAIIWLVGGDTNTLDDVWTPADPSGDETAGQYREVGIVMMFPSQRGGNDNPGRKEGFFGEVDDVIAAAAFLAKQPYVDPARIYLGGHSTGGTLALLVAAAAPAGRFRAVIAFGPVADVDRYPRDFLPFDPWDARELELRSPRRWINTVSTPTFVLEGAHHGNLADVELLAKTARTPLVHFFPIANGTHFTILAPMNRYLASRIVGPWSSRPPSLTEAEVDAATSQL